MISDRSSPILRPRLRAPDFVQLGAESDVAFPVINDAAAGTGAGRPAHPKDARAGPSGRMALGRRGRRRRRRLRRTNERAEAADSRPPGGSRFSRTNP